MLLDVDVSDLILRRLSTKDALCLLSTQMEYRRTHTMLRQFSSTYKSRGEQQMSHPFWRQVQADARAAASLHATAATLVHLAASKEPRQFYVACLDGDALCMRIMRPSTWCSSSPSS